MAPEQMAGSRASIIARTLFLAVVFYEMLTGTIPMGHFAPPSKKAAVDVRFDEVILKAMATEPVMRFQSVRDLRAGLDQIASVVAGEPNPSMAAMPGFSTIIDRGVAGAWRMMNGREPAVAARKTVRSCAAGYGSCGDRSGESVPALWHDCSVLRGCESSCGRWHICCRC